MPKLAFIGWNFSLFVDMYLAKLPIIVNSENITFSVSFNLDTAFKDATIPDDIDSTYPSTPVICPAKYIFGLDFKLYV